MWSAVMHAYLHAHPKCISVSKTDLLAMVSPTTMNSLIRKTPPHPTPRAYPYVSRISNAYHECRLHHVTSPSHLTTASAANAGKTCVQSKNLAMWRLLLESMRYMPSLLEMATNKSCENTTH